MNNQNNDPYKVLESSTMFHMSLGSKELFHSNFLHWISIINWEAFLEIMHGLAGVKEFWWEKIEEVGKKKYHINNNNVKVLREYHNFDLSVYIKYNEQIEEDEQDQEDSTDETEDMRGWIPVLILENKMKSLPYEEQLDKYTKKAFEEWARIMKDEAIKKEPNKTLEVSGDSKNSKNSITFILLSLMQPNLPNYKFKNSKEGSRPKYVLSLYSKWKNKTYNDLFKLLEDVVKNHRFNDLDKSIIKDYCNFINALCNIANSKYWKVYNNDNYHAKIIENRINESKLRIADIREKIIHERMIQILVKKLDDINLTNEHWDKDYESKNKKDYKTGIVYYQTSFSRGKGITEAFVIINKDYRLMIQLQGEQYRRCLILHKISNDSAKNRDPRWKKILDELKNKKLWVKDGSDWTEDYNPQNKFGDYFKYSYKKIGAKMSVGIVLDEMAQDLRNIINFYYLQKI